VGDLPAATEMSLIFELAVTSGAIGTTHAIAVDVTWSDGGRPQAETSQVALPPLRLVTVEEAQRVPVDAVVSEERVLQLADAAQREAMRMDREGRHAESRNHLREHVSMLAAAPQSARVVDRLAVMEELAEHDASHGYASDVRKQAVADVMGRSRGNRQEGNPS
jgi:hypothetical protein